MLKFPRVYINVIIDINNFLIVLYIVLILLSLGEQFNPASLNPRRILKSCL